MKEPLNASAPASEAVIPPTLDRGQMFYLWLTSVFVTSLLVANIVGSKFFHFGTLSLGGIEFRIEHSVGMFAFPITFLLTDLLNEYYGPKAARRVTAIGLVMSALAFVLIFAATNAPAAPEGRTFIDEGKFDAVLSASGVMIFASMMAYMCSQLTDIFTFGLFKRLTGGKLVWLRTTGSTVISQAVDSLAIMTVLYLTQTLADGTPPSLEFALAAALKGYLIKFSIAVAITPLVYAGRAVVSRFIGLQPLPVAARRT